MKTCLVFGKDGYFGSHLIHYLTHCENWVVNAIGRFDIAGMADDEFDVDYVFYLVGAAGILSSFEQPEVHIESNICVLSRIIARIKRTPFRPLFIYPSTRLVYRGSSESLVEDSITESRSMYSATKRACEAIIEAYSFAFKMPFIILRIGVVYGSLPGMNNRYGTIEFLEGQSSKGEITIFGDGSQRRTFVHINDVCRGLIEVAAQTNKSSQCPNIFNFPGEDFSIREVAQMIARRDGSTLRYLAWPEIYRQTESGSTVFSAKKFHSAYNFSLKYTLVKWLSTKESGLSMI